MARFKIFDVIIGKKFEKHIAVVLGIETNGLGVLYKLFWIGKEDVDYGKIDEYSSYYIDENYEIYKG